MVRALLSFASNHASPCHHSITCAGPYGFFVACRMVKKDLTGYMPYMSGRASKYQTKAKQAKQLDSKSRATGAVVKRR